MTTMREVAEKSGVSIATVSRFLNGGSIAEDKKRIIAEVIEKTGYQPSASAQSLRSGRSKLVGIVVSKVSSESIARSVDGISTVMTERGYQVLLASTNNHPEREPGFIELFERHPVDGIILFATQMTAKHRAAIKGCRVPIVVNGQRVPGANCLFNDEYGAARELAARLAASGTEHPAYIGATRLDASIGAARADGYRDGMAEVGISLRESCCVESDLTSESGYEAALGLLRAGEPIDTISCATDVIAAGAIRAIHDGGAQAAGGARKIRVSGFGDNQMVKMLSGGIPTVHFGLKTSGMRAAELLLDIIEGRESLPVQICSGYSIVGI